MENDSFFVDFGFLIPFFLWGVLHVNRLEQWEVLFVMVVAKIEFEFLKFFLRF